MRGAENRVRVVPSHVTSINSSLPDPSMYASVPVGDIA